MHDQAEHIDQNSSDNASPHASVSGVFRRAMYSAFPWHDPKDYPGCVRGLSEALDMPISSVKSNAYKARGPSARACRLLAQFIKTRISEMTLLAWELESEADRIDAKTALKPGLQALARLRQQKSQNP